MTNDKLRSQNLRIMFTFIINKCCNHYFLKLLLIYSKRYRCSEGYTIPSIWMIDFQKAGMKA